MSCLIRCREGVSGTCKMISLLNTLTLNFKLVLDPAWSALKGLIFPVVPKSVVKQYN